MANPADPVLTHIPENIYAFPTFGTPPDGDIAAVPKFPQGVNMASHSADGSNGSGASLLTRSLAMYNDHAPSPPHHPSSPRHNPAFTGMPSSLPAFQHSFPSQGLYGMLDVRSPSPPAQIRSFPRHVRKTSFDHTVSREGLIPGGSGRHQVNGKPMESPSSLVSVPFDTCHLYLSLLQ